MNRNVLSVRYQIVIADICLTITSGKKKKDYSLNMGLIMLCIIISDHHCRSSRVSDLTGARGGFDVSLLIT